MANKENLDNQVDNVQEAEELEETLAADSIATKGNAAEVGQLPSKAQAMSSVMNAMSNMSAEDLNGFMATMAQYSAGKTWGVDPSAAVSNAATLNMKPSAASAMKEDLTVMFDGEDLSEDFKEKASTLFEAVVNARLANEIAILEEEFEVSLNEKVESLTAEITEKLDSYLDYAVEQWKEENQVAIESTLRSELTNDFIDGLKNLFAEHYIDVPEDKVDVLESLAEKVQILETKLDEMITENSELRGVVMEEAMKDIVEKVSSDLALTQKEKFNNIAEGLEFDGDLELFENKLMTIKESYFGKSEKSHQESNILEESFDGEVSETGTNNTDPLVGRYVEAISKSVKK